MNEIATPVRGREPDDAGASANAAAPGSAVGDFYTRIALERASYIDPVVQPAP